MTFGLLKSFSWDAIFWINCIRGKDVTPKKRIFDLHVSVPVEIQHLILFRSLVPVLTDELFVDDLNLLFTYRLLI